MNASELRDKTPDELRKELVVLKKEQFNLRFQKATGQAESTVRMKRSFQHPVMKKTIRKNKSYRAHDAQNQFKIGDKVRIEECAPISKTKRWTVLQD